MNAVARRLVLMVFVASVAAVPFQVWATIPGGVSPGLLDRLAAIGTRCPTFSWQEVADAAGYDLVAYALPEATEPAAVTSAELVAESEVLYARILGGATSWTPALDQCLAAGGSYVWFVRAVFEYEAGEEVPGDWSNGLFFAVVEAPSAEEVAEALKVLRRYVGDDATALGEPDEVTTAGSRTVSRVASTHPSPSPKAVPSAKTAIRGALSDPVGEVYGVVGVVSAPEGAGLAAANLAGGADLVLDGSSTGEADTFLTQSSLNRPSDGDELFALFNPGPGTLSLEVEGVLFGNGSGLFDVNAAALGGLGPAGWANKEELATAGAVPVHWGNLADVPPDLADGDQDTTYTAGPGLVLDGGELSAVWPGGDWGRHITTTIDSIGGTGHGTSITIGSDGLGLISYWGNIDDGLKVAHCHDISCTTATTTAIDGAGWLVALPTSITTGSDGLGLVSYWLAPGLKVAHCDNTACTSASTTLVDSAGAGTSSITVGRDGMGLISYVDAANNLNVAHCGNLTCTTSTTSTIDSSGRVDEHTSIAIGSDGLGLISYYDATSKDLRVAHCDNVPCSSASLWIVDSTDNVGSHSSIAVGSDGLGLISYFDASNSALKVAHCSGPVCSSATITTIDSVGVVGLHTSITIGLDGLGVISYQRNDTGRLKVAHCGNIVCDTASSMGLGTTGFDGFWTSITLGADGAPLISHHDASVSDLLVTHCSNRFCIPHVRYR